MKDTYTVADIASSLGCSEDEVRKLIEPVKQKESETLNPKKIDSGNLASEIKARIESMNISQQEFAKRINLPKGSLSSILCGAWHFSPAVAEKIVDFFNKKGLSLNLSVEEVVRLSQQAMRDYRAKRGWPPVKCRSVPQAPVTLPKEDTPAEKEGERWFEFMEGQKHMIHFFPESAIQCISFAESFTSCDWAVISIELKNGKKFEHRYDCDNRVLGRSYVHTQLRLRKMLTQSNRLFDMQHCPVLARENK